MEKEKEAKEERNNERTAGMVNGDMGDGSAEQCDDHSPPHTNRTGAESPTENEDRGTGTESEHGNGEGGSDHKVRTCLLVAFPAPKFSVYLYLDCDGCLVSAAQLNLLN